MYALSDRLLSAVDHEPGALWVTQTSPRRELQCNPLLNSAVMKTSSAVLLYTLSLLLASEAWQGSSNLTCVYDSVETVTCNWTQSQNTTEEKCTLTGHQPEYQPTHYKLEPLPPQICQLHDIGATMKSCKLIFDKVRYDLTVSDSIRLTVSCHHGGNWREESRNITPFENLQLQPPHSVQMKSERKPSYNLTWQLHNVSNYLEGNLEYEVAYEKPDDPDKAVTILPITYDQQWIEIENLSPGTEYEAAVRVKVQDYSGYKSIWSHWSTMLKWRTYPKETPSFSFPGVFLAFGIILIIVLTAAVLVRTQILKRLQKVLKIHLPDPVMFFPSLTAVHGGDVQKWLSSPLSMDPSHIAASSSDVSVLEVLQKDSQDPCLLLLKDYPTPMDAPETSGHSLSSCFVNRGYFFFHHLHSLEIEPCKVYFTYDPFALENSDSEDDDSYQALHTTSDCLPLPSYSLVGSQESVSLLPEMKEPTQKFRQTISPPSTGRCPPASTTEQGETQTESKAIFPVSISLHLSSMGVSSIHEPPNSSADEVEEITDVAKYSSSTGDNTPSFLQPMMLNPSKAIDVCRTESCNQDPNSEAYLSLRELQSQYSHQSV